jgi:hypothetical protein
MRIVSGVAGVALLLVTAGSILRNVVVPRGLASTVVRLLWRGLRRVLVLLARPFGTYEARDKLLAWLAPAVLVGMLLCWLAALFLAYGLIMYAVSGLRLAASLREAGSSMFTLGYASGQGRNLTLLDFLAAATGPVVIALQISYLPQLYNAYNRRETEVTLLQARAADPAWGPELLARQALVGTVDQLAGLYQNWERLAADIGESHANYPVLLAFRSPRPYRSWIVALLAVMDAAAMHLSLAPTSAPAAQARLMLRSGFTALRDIARVLRLPFNPDPRPEDEVGLTYDEYAAAVDHVLKAGFITERTAEQSWPHFRGWRVNYEPIGYALARKVDAVPALWTGDRDWDAEPMAPSRPEDRRPGSSRVDVDDPHVAMPLKE